MDIWKMNFNSIIRFIMAIFVIFYAYYISSWFTLTLKVSFLSIDFYDACYLLLGLIIIIDMNNIPF